MDDDANVEPYISAYCLTCNMLPSCYQKHKKYACNTLCYWNKTTTIQPVHPESIATGALFLKAAGWPAWRRIWLRLLKASWENPVIRRKHDGSQLSIPIFHQVIPSRKMRLKNPFPEVVVVNKNENKQQYLEEIPLLISDFHSHIRAEIIKILSIQERRIIDC